MASPTPPCRSERRFASFPGLPALVLVAFLAGLSMSAALAGESFSFGVLSQRSPVLTAQYWNPIFDYVQRRTGIALVLKVARTGQESSDATEQGLYDFVYSNHIFRPRMAAANYQVILRPRDEAITGQVVTLAESPIRQLKDLEGKEVGFPSAAAFVGYAVPMDQLLRRNITVTPVFGGNQEGIMAQLKAGRVLAAGVNGQVMKSFAQREDLRYRVLWESAPFLNLPVAVHPRVPKSVADAVRKAIDGMDGDPEGQKILQAAANLIAQPPPYGFRASSPEEYRSYTDFYKNTRLKDLQ
ncbi:MAG: phosphate/phosphite/phosphonate ABC transporter substrate-binding protein [Rhodocyclales bacterium]|nr:phosphate/phosphite/phosphonate ABC transporter substrate-binding protein [Rhodocyclales bacterium]MBI5786700.1 phosphate/phosphite/phosphonate ABC transporter substrate-binding protein [Rhodocyclales bacterium]